MKKMQIRKNKGHKFLYYLVFLFGLYICININFKKVKFESSNEEFINNILQSSSYHLVTNEENIIDNIISKISNIDMKKPVTIIDKVFAYQNDIEIQNIQEFSYIQNIVVDKPRVYIYNTHPKEGYNDTDFNVVMASLMLQEKLNSFGIQTLVESRDAGKYIEDNNLTNNYSATKQFLKDALNKYGSFDLIIDLHRDSVPNGVSTVTEINGKNYAKVMFVMNVNYSNYQLAQKINKILNSKYSTISRGIYDKQFDSFNQELNSNAVLIEVGSTKNSYEEVKNTIGALAESIKELLNER